MRHAMPGQLITKVDSHEVSTLPTDVAHERRVARSVIFLRGGANIDVYSQLTEREEHDAAVAWLRDNEERALSTQDLFLPEND